LLRLVVGLGNPSPKYGRTRHNVGREFIEFLASETKEVFKKSRQAEILRLPIFIGAKLDCFMNESGGPVKELLMTANAKLDEILIVVDDFMIPFGTLRLRPGGSSGGHNGLKSIIEVLGTDQFARLRVGVGPVPEGLDPADFVLQKFTRDEQSSLPKLYAAVNDGIDAIVAGDVQKAMNSVNKSYL
jgi:PTH1 family peptidyl-tRNA hydrolase